ncbi:hypothetical protein BEI46_16395 [Aliivibrio fischeri]|nr:hypothetical protein BEI46_16395 [Aliivibrio fischeri]
MAIHFAEQNLIEFSERIEQDIPDSCMFSKIERLIEFKSESQRTCLTGHGLLELEEREEVKSKLVWSSAISTELNLTGSLSALDELRLGAFKQRVISAFLAIL